MIGRRLAVVVAGAAVMLSACTSAAPSSGGGAGASGGTASGCTVGVSWNNYSQERWKKADEPAMQKAIAAKGGKYIRADANDKAEQQTTDIANLINQGAKVLIVLAKDSEAIKPAMADAEAKGVKIIAYDRLIEDPNTFYITFDNKKVGTLMAQTLIKLVPKGNYAVILGAETDPNSAFRGVVVRCVNLPLEKAPLRERMHERFGVPVGLDNDANAAAIGEWRAGAGRGEDDLVMLTLGTGVGGGVVIDGLIYRGATGLGAELGHMVVQADGPECPGSCPNRGCLEALCSGTALNAVKAPGDLPAAAAPASVNAAAFQTPKGNSVQSIILTPTAITKANLKDTVDAGWVTKDAVCAGVPAGSVPPC